MMEVIYNAIIIDGDGTKITKKVGNFKIIVVDHNVVVIDIYCIMINFAIIIFLLLDIDFTDTYMKAAKKVGYIMNIIVNFITTVMAVAKEVAIMKNIMDYFNNTMIINIYHIDSTIKDAFIYTVIKVVISSYMAVVGVIIIIIVIYINVVAAKTNGLPPLHYCNFSNTLETSLLSHFLNQKILLILL